jgi:hypothetical protein
VCGDIKNAVRHTVDFKAQAFNLVEIVAGRVKSGSFVSGD